MSTATRKASRVLEAREVRLALLEERGHRLPGLGGREPLAEDQRLLGDGLRNGRAMALLQQALGEPQRFGRQRGKRGDRLSGLKKSCSGGTTSQTIPISCA